MSEIVHAVIPSYCRPVPELRALVEGLRSAGVQPVIAATSRDLAEGLAASELPVFDVGSNPGFASTVNAAVRYLDRAVGGRQWLCIVNDDVALGPKSATRIREALSTAGTSGIIYLDPGEPRRIPSRLQVFLILSLLEKFPVFRRLLRPKDVNNAHLLSREYRSFSFVAIRQEIYSDLGGLNEEFVFTFEDADFAKRASAVGVVQVVRDVEAVHAGSSSTRKYVGNTLPAIAWSAQQYLGGREHERAAKFLVLAALGVRTLLVPFGSARKVDHWLGCFRAAVTVGVSSRPSLGPYDRS